MSDHNALPPVFTIITVTYNAAATVERTLQSVAVQDLEGVEHLVIDGASTDGSLTLLQQAADGGSIRLTSEPDRGLYDAMNKAIAKATGQYLLFLNAGDCLHDVHTLSHVAQLIAAQPRHPAVVYGDTDIVDMEGRFLRHRRLSPPERLSWKSFRQGMLVCHQAFFVRADVARQETYDLDYRFSADFDWCIRVMKKAEGLGLPLLNAHAVITDYLDGGLTTKNHRHSLIERLRIMARHYGWPQAVLMHLYFVGRAILKK